MARTLSAPITTEKNLLWSRPFCTGLFKFGGAIGDVYIGEFDAAILGNSHEGIAKSWGEYNLVTPPRDGYFPVVTAQATLINHLAFSGGTKRFSDLWAGLGPYSVEADIYLNFLKTGTSSEWLQTLAFAAVMRPGRYSPDECEIELKSISEKYLDKQIGYILNQTDLPSIDPDEIGKPANIVVGKGTLAVAQWVVAGKTGPLRADMTTGSTTVPITDELYDALPATGTVRIGTETAVIYGGKSGAAGSRVLDTLTRGAPEAHHKDDLVLQVLAEYVALASWCPNSTHVMNAIPQVYIERDGKVIPVAATIELANTTLVAGQVFSLIKFSTPPVIPVKDLVALTDGIGVSDTIGISQPNTESDWIQNGSDETPTFPSATILANGNQSITPSFPAQEKTKSSGNFIANLAASLPSTAGFTGGMEIRWVKPGGGELVLFTNGVPVAPSPYQDAGTSYGLGSLRRYNISGVDKNPGAGTISLSAKKISYKISIAATKTGSASKTGSATLPSTSTADILIGRVLFDYEGLKDDGSGTYTGSASSVIEKCADVMHFLARVLGAVPASRVDAATFATARTDAPASYKFAGVLTDRSTSLRALLLALGMQCRTRPEWPVDTLQARFIKSSYAAVSAKTITRDAIKRASLSCRLGPEDDLVNVIDDFRYGRDWSKPRGEDAFTKVAAKVSDATSITRYGERRGADRFWCDFIGADNPTMANDLRDFRLAELKEPPRCIDLIGYLDQFEILPGDLFAPNYLDADGNIFDGLDGTKKFLVEEAGFNPGILSRQQGPKMRFVLREVA